ncbi:MAG: ATPase [Leptothrix sp. (in: Bacteria)]|nr:ATPase [Leptothrix sp. (in: b-proteobacteria)]
MPEALQHMNQALRVAIVGAESTGKTTLAAALAERLAQERGRRVAWVPEVLREWCDHTGRTPQAHEQASILRAQHERLQAAAEAHDIVVCDTTALMTAVYSRLVFGDASLEQRAVALHRGAAATLLTALDLPWVADGHQRDGPQVRVPVDQALRELMGAHGIDYAVVGGTGTSRVDNAMAALAPMLRQAQVAARPTPAGGLFTRLGHGGAGVPGAAGHRRWACECCVPEYERALRRAR